MDGIEVDDGSPIELVLDGGDPDVLQILQSSETRQSPEPTLNSKHCDGENFEGDLVMEESCPPVGEPEGGLYPRIFLDNLLCEKELSEIS